MEKGLPPKKEYVLYAPLTVKQRELYDAIVNGHLRAILMRAGKGGAASEAQRLLAESTAQEGMTRRSHTKGKGVRRKYTDDGDDDEYFKKLESGELGAEKERYGAKGRTAEELGREWQLKAQCRSFLSSYSFPSRLTLAAVP